MKKSKKVDKRVTVLKLKNLLKRSACFARHVGVCENGAAADKFQKLADKYLEDLENILEGEK